MARPALIGTPAKTALTSGVGGATINLPAGITAGEGIVIAYTIDDPGKAPASAGWSDRNNNDGGADSGRTNGFLYKRASGSEGTTLAVTWSGTAAITCIAGRFSGVVAAGDIMPQAVFVLEAAAEDPYTFAANAITSVGAASICVFGFGLDASQRTVVTPDAALTLVDFQVSGTPSDHTQYFYYEATPGSGNAAYSNDMSDTRRYSGIVGELVGVSSSTIVDDSMLPPGLLWTPRYDPSLMLFG